MLAGRGFGKTRSGAEWVRSQMCGTTPLARGRVRHMALIAETAADARDVLVGDRSTGDDRAGDVNVLEEPCGILQVHPREFRPRYERIGRGRLVWPNGAIASIYNATEPDQLRGPQHDAAWCDELAKFRYGQETWDNLEFGLRSGSNPRVLITTTPKPIKLLKAIISDPDTIVTGGHTDENLGNLSPKFIARVIRKYEGTRLGRQELAAEVLEDAPGALWQRSVIDALRVKAKDVPDLRRVIVSIDPAASANEDSDETGIICAGTDAQGHGYVLDDLSGIYKPYFVDERGRPSGWAAEAIAVMRARQADMIVAEVNNGGDMVEAVLRAADTNVPYRAVRASRGKVIRAAPIALFYERGLVHHVGFFSTLEDQLCSFTDDYDRARNGSPDRLDALVWALTELMDDQTGATAWISFMAGKAAEAQKVPEDKPNNRPWRVQQNEPSLDDGGDLMKIYEQAYAGGFEASYNRKPTCARCKEPITDSTKVTDGVDSWHVGCAR